MPMVKINKVWKSMNRSKKAHSQQSDVFWLSKQHFFGHHTRVDHIWESQHCYRAPKMLIRYLSMFWDRAITEYRSIVKCTIHISSCTDGHTAFKKHGVTNKTATFTAAACYKRSACRNSSTHKTLPWDETSVYI